MRARMCKQCGKSTVIHFKGGFCSTGCRNKDTEQRNRALNYADFDERDAIPEVVKVVAPLERRGALLAEAKRLLMQGA